MFRKYLSKRLHLQKNFSRITIKMFSPSAGTEIYQDDAQPAIFLLYSFYKGCELNANEFCKK